MSNKTEWILKKETELRCEVSSEPGSTLSLKLISGSAEIFGVEMAPNREYIFHDQNLAVFTWYGCTLESIGDRSGMYVADTTPMVAYVNTHIQLEARRDVALANGDFGPRALIVGPTDHGKSTFAQILTAYAARLDRTPILVDLDCGQPLFSVPGTIGSIPLDKSNLNAEEGFVNFNPLIYFYGHSSPRDNSDHYKAIVKILASQVFHRLEKDIDAKSSGLIINTCGWIDEKQGGYDIILHCIREFKVDVVLVMDHDKLYSNLLSVPDLGVTRPAIVKLPHSGGVVKRDSIVRKRLRKNRIREYFYGRLTPNQCIAFSPERREGLQLSSFIFLRVGGVQLSEGMKIVEKSAHQDTCTLYKIEPTSKLSFSIAAVLHDIPAEILEKDSISSSVQIGDVSQKLLQSNVAGFINILQISPDKDRMTILSPCPGSLPSHYLLVGSIEWVE